MFGILKEKFIFIFFLAMLIITQGRAFALYDVVNAKTVSNENMIQDAKDSQDDTVDIDMDLPNYNPQRDIASLLQNKFKKIFRPKQENVEQEEIIEEPIANKEQTQEENNFIPYVEQEVIDDYKFQINADKVTYDDEDGGIDSRIIESEIINKLL